MAKKSGRGRKVSLAAFLRKLWSNEDLMLRFSESRASRQAVLKEYNLSPRHEKLLREGCTRDIMVELAGATKLAESTTSIIECDKGHADVSCGHPECKAFMDVVARKAPKPKKKR